MHFAALIALSAVVPAVLSHPVLSDSDLITRDAGIEARSVVSDILQERAIEEGNLNAPVDPKNGPVDSKTGPVDPKTGPVDSKIPAKRKGMDVDSDKEGGEKENNKRRTRRKGMVDNNREEEKEKHKRKPKRREGEMDLDGERPKRHGENDREEDREKSKRKPKRKEGEMELDGERSSKRKGNGVTPKTTSGEPETPGLAARAYLD